MASQTYTFKEEVITRFSIIGCSGVQKGDKYCVKIHLQRDVFTGDGPYAMGLREIWSSDWIEGTYTPDIGVAVLAAQVKIDKLGEV